MATRASMVVKALFKRYPMASNAVVYGTLVTGAEFTQQTITKKFLVKDTEPQPIDKASLGRYAIMGTLIYPNVLYIWVGFREMNVGTTISFQLKNGKPAPYDFGTITRYAVLGLGIYPHVYYVWYRWLDGRYVGTATKTIVKKLLLDQFVLTPPLLCAFFIIMSAMERKADIFEECRKKLVPTFQTSCMFWLPAQTLNFIFVPPVARVVYVGTCAFIWVNILVWIKRQEY